MKGTWRLAVTSPAVHLLLLFGRDAAFCRHEKIEWNQRPQTPSNAVLLFHRPSSNTLQPCPILSSTTSRPPTPVPPKLSPVRLVRSRREGEFRLYDVHLKNTNLVGACQTMPVGGLDVAIIRKTRSIVSDDHNQLTIMLPMYNRKNLRLLKIDIRYNVRDHGIIFVPICIASLRH